MQQQQEGWRDSHASEADMEGEAGGRGVASAAATARTTATATETATTRAGEARRYAKEESVEEVDEREIELEEVCCSMSSWSSSTSARAGAVGYSAAMHQRQHSARDRSLQQKQQQQQQLNIPDAGTRRDAGLPRLASVAPASAITTEAKGGEIGEEAEGRDNIARESEARAIAAARAVMADDDDDDDDEPKGKSSDDGGPSDADQAGEDQDQDQDEGGVYFPPRRNRSTDRDGHSDDEGDDEDKGRKGEGRKTDKDQRRQKDDTSRDAMTLAAAKFRRASLTNASPYDAAGAGPTITPAADGGYYFGSGAASAPAPTAASAASAASAPFQRRASLSANASAGIIQDRLNAQAEALRIMQEEVERRRDERRRQAEGYGASVGANARRADTSAGKSGTEWRWGTGGAVSLKSRDTSALSVHDNKRGGSSFRGGGEAKGESLGPRGEAGGNAGLDRVKSFFRSRSSKNKQRVMQHVDSGVKGSNDDKDKSDRVLDVAADAADGRSNRRGRNDKIEHRSGGTGTGFAFGSRIGSSFARADPLEGKAASLLGIGDDPVSAAILAHSGGKPLFFSLLLSGTVSILLLLIPAFYAPPFPPDDVSSSLSPSPSTFFAHHHPPPWHSVLTVGVPLVQGMAAVLLLAGSASVASTSGSALASCLSRHCSFYLLLVATSYLAVDGAYFRRASDAAVAAEGGEAAYPSTSRAERIARLAVSSVLAVASFASLVATGGGPVHRAEMASRRVDRHLDRREFDGLSGLPTILTPPSSSSSATAATARETMTSMHFADRGSALVMSARKVVERSKSRRTTYRRLVWAGSVGHQVVAFVFAARTVSDLLMRHSDGIVTVGNVLPPAGRRALTQPGASSTVLVFVPEIVPAATTVVETTAAAARGGDDENRERVASIPLIWGLDHPPDFRPDWAADAFAAPSVSVDSLTLERPEEVPSMFFGSVISDPPLGDVVSASSSYDPSSLFPRRFLAEVQDFDDASARTTNSDTMHIWQGGMPNASVELMKVQSEERRGAEMAFNPRLEEYNEQQQQSPQTLLRGLQQATPLLSSSPSHGGDSVLPLVAFEIDLRGSFLLLSLLESISSFLYSAFVLALFSAAQLAPLNGGTVAAAALAALVKVLLGCGYLVNLSLKVGSAGNADGVWSAILTTLDLSASALVLIATVFYNDSWKSASRYVPEDALTPHSVNRSSMTAQRTCRTLRWIATAPRHLYSKSKRRNAASLFLASNAFLTFGTVQALLLLSYNTNIHESHHVVDMAKFGAQLCLLYGFINYMSLSEGGVYYPEARKAIIAISLGGMALTSWQIYALASMCSAQGAGSMSAADGAVMALLVKSLLSYNFMCVSSVALVEVGEDDDVSGVDFTLNVCVKKAAAGQGILEEEIETANIRRRRVRRVLFYLYLPIVLAFGINFAVNEGRDAAEGASFYPFVNVDLSSPTRKAWLDRGLGGGGGRREGGELGAVRIRRGRSLQDGGGSIRVHPSLFLLEMNCPGLHLLLHYGLVLPSLVVDSARVRPALSFSLTMARLIAAHSCIVLVAFLGSMFDYTIAGENWDGGVGEGAGAWHNHTAGQKSEFVLLLAWFVASIPLAMSLHALWSGRWRATKAADSLGIRELDADKSWG